MYRLAMDIGTHSLGWCVFSLNEKVYPESILDMGVRIFSDGRNLTKDGASLAVTRRTARQARRRRDRFLKRKNALMEALVNYGLMPCDLDARKKLELFDPYKLRAEGLTRQLSPYELGRALFHINQRRGFKSNRKTGASDENGKIASGVQRLREHLETASAKTLGEYLYACKQEGKPTRIRSEGTGAKLRYPFYPDRSLLENEFDTLMTAQNPPLAHLTEDQIQHVRDIIFYQRPLKPVLPGRCSLEPAEQRAALALPVAQKVRILQTLNHLRVINGELQERLLTLEERNKVLVPLQEGKRVTFTQLRKMLGIDASHTFNLENPEADKIEGDQTAKALSKKDCFGASWFTVSPEKQRAVIARLLEEEDADVLQAELMQEYTLTAEAANKVVQAKLPDGYAAHCEQVLCKLCDAMNAEVLSYAEARVTAGYPYKEQTGEIAPSLPYYGRVLQRYVGRTGEAKEPLEARYGRIANPTVHIALNQVRRVVNELIKKYGLPTQIVIEVARDLKNGLKAKEEIARRQRENKKLNDLRKQKLQEHAISITQDSMLRMRLWEELAENPAARCCVYTGEPIPFGRLFGDDIEIEHILPFSRTLDNSPSNKTVALRRANRDKGNKSPSEAFAKKQGYSWEGILTRAASLPVAKRWRFAENAMEEFDKDEGFLTRQLVDTQYIARVAREYVCAVCPPNQVWVTPGKLTNNLARAWGFAKKNRDQHIHHAIDAALIGVTDRHILQQAARHNASGTPGENARLFAGLAQPWPNFASHVLVAASKIIVSHKTDHGIAGELHNPQPYGVLAANGEKNNAQQRKAVEAFTTIADLLPIKEIKLKAELLRDISGKSHSDCLDFLQKIESVPPAKAKKIVKDFCSIDDKTFVDTFLNITHSRGIRRIRVLETKTLIPIKNKKAVVYKGLVSSSNAWIDIYENAHGKGVHETVSTFTAHGKEFCSKYTHQGYTHIMRLFKNDMVELEENDTSQWFYVLKFGADGKIYLIEHREGNADRRNRDKEDSFTLQSRSAGRLQQLKAKAVYLTPAGTIIYRERVCHVTARCGNKRE